MQIEQTTLESLNARIRTRVPFTKDNARVFVARHNGRVVGTAAAEHVNGPDGRMIILRVDPKTKGEARDTLVSNALRELSPLKRAVMVVQADQFRTN